MRDALLQGMGLLRARPDGGDPSRLEIGNGAARTHRGVRLKGPFVARFHFLRGGREDGGSVSLIRHYARGLGSGGAHVAVQIFAFGKGLHGRAPANLERFRGADSRPFILGDHADKIAFHDDFHHAGNTLQRLFVYGGRSGSDAGGPDHAAVKHAGDAHVGNVGEVSKNFRGHVHAREGGAYDGVTRGVFRLAGALHVESEAGAGNVERIV